MALKLRLTTKAFVLIVAIIIGGTRYMNKSMSRVNLNEEAGVWDTKQKDGLRYTVVTRSNETGGEYALLHVYCTPKAQGFYPKKPCSLPAHIHNAQMEQFETISGVLSMDLNGTLTTVPVGDKLTIPAGFPHTFWNGGSEPLEFTLRLTPGIPDEGFFETLYGLSQQNDGLNSVNPIQLLLLFAENGMVLTDVPEPIWDAATKMVVPLGKLLGFRTRYPEYTSKAGQPVPVAHPAAAAAGGAAAA